MLQASTRVASVHATHANVVTIVRAHASFGFAFHIKRNCTIPNVLLGLGLVIYTSRKIMPQYCFSLRQLLQHNLTGKLWSTPPVRISQSDLLLWHGILTVKLCPTVLQFGLLSYGGITHVNSRDKRCCACPHVKNKGDYKYSLKFALCTYHCE